MKIKDIVTFVSKSITPKPGVTYNLYSLPSFDEGKTSEILDGTEIQSNKYDVPNKCILFNKLNVRFRRVWKVDNYDENKISSTEFLPLVVNENVVDFQYCYYLLISDRITNYLCGQNTNTSGSHKRIDPNNFLDIEITLPKMSIQKQIGKTLSALDRKIEINKWINDNLEAMAKQLYDYWFVQFDFPNEEGKPYKSSGGVMVWNEKLKREIPKGWHCGTLLDIAEYTNGLACQKYRPTDDNKLPVIKIKEMHDGLSVDTEWVKADIPDEVKVFDGDVLFSWSASLEVMLWAYGNGGLNQHIFKVTSKNGYPRSFYFYQLIHYIGVFKQMAEARKTTMGHITQDHLRQSSIVLPPNVDIANKLEEKLCPIFDAIVKNSQEIMTLTKQRDELLPLLMNGQASVNYHLSVVNVVARLPFYRRLPIFMYCFILLLLSRLSWYNKNVLYFKMLSHSY